MQSPPLQELVESEYFPLPQLSQVEDSCKDCNFPASQSAHSANPSGAEVPLTQITQVEERAALNEALPGDHARLFEGELRPAGSSEAIR